MSDPTHHIYAFGDFRLDTAERQLVRQGQEIPLPPKVFDTLVLLVRNSGHLLEKERMMRELWPDTFVEETNLSVNISALRKALGELDGQHFIDTVPKRGYRFSADVTQTAADQNDLLVHSRVRGRVVTEEFTEPLTADTPGTNHLPKSEHKNGRLVLFSGALVLSLVSVAVYFGIFRSKVSTLPVNSMAVLPFQALNRTTDNDYLALGIADDLINRLSALKHIVVRPTAAVRKYDNGSQDPIASGKELKVDAVLQGNIQSTGDRIRVTVALVNVYDGRTLWSDKFDEPLKDLLALEDAISQRVAESVSPKLTGEERNLLTEHHAVSAEAHDAYLKGRYSLNKRTRVGIQKAIEYFHQAIDLDQGYARAYAGLADSYLALYDFQFGSAEDCVLKAKAAEEKALAIDETLADAHASVGRLMWLYYRDPAAEREFTRAIDLDGNYATARLWRSRYLAEVGRLDEAIAEMKRAQELDPLSLSIASNIGLLYYYSRQYDRAVEQLRRTAELEPKFVLTYWFLGNTYERMNQYPEAIGEYERALTLQGDQPSAKILEDTFKSSGYKTAIRAFVEDCERRQKDEWGLSYTIARYSAVLGDKEIAFHWLEQARKDHHPWLVGVNVDPQFERLRDDPRFAELVKPEVP